MPQVLERDPNGSTDRGCVRRYRGESISMVNITAGIENTIEFSTHISAPAAI